MADVVSSFRSATDELRVVSDRLSRVQIMCRPAVELIRKFDAPDALFYGDPPYVHSARVDAGAYRHEMSDADHRALAAVLRALRGKCVLSGYPSPPYDDLYPDWHRVEINVPLSSAGGRAPKRVATECLWLNFEPTAGAAPKDAYPVDE